MTGCDAITDNPRGIETTKLRTPSVAPVAWLLLLAPASALAAPPDLTEDPEPVEEDHWELYLTEQAIFGHSGFSGATPLLEVNYGAAPGLQLHAVTPFVPVSGGVGYRIRTAAGEAESWFPGWQVTLGPKE